MTRFLFCLSHLQYHQIPVYSVEFLYIKAGKQSILWKLWENKFRNYQNVTFSYTVNQAEFTGASLDKFYD